MKVWVEWKSSILGRMKLLETVALLTDLPKEGLVRGQVGTIVEVLAPGVFLVEFSDDEGKTYGLLPLEEGRLLELEHVKTA